MRIYVAGPYSAITEEERLANANKAIDIGVELMKRGHTIFVPHLCHFIHQRWPGISWERWMSVDLDILQIFDAIFFINPSRGATIELNRAMEWGVKVYYNVSEVPIVEAKDYRRV